MSDDWEDETAADPRLAKETASLRQRPPSRPVAAGSRPGSRAPSRPAAEELVFPDTTAPSDFGESTELDLRLGDEIAAVRAEAKAEASVQKIIVGQPVEEPALELITQPPRAPAARPRRAPNTLPSRDADQGPRTLTVILVVIAIGLLGVLIGFGAVWLRAR